MRINVYSEELEPLVDKYGRRVTLNHKNVVPGITHSAIEIIVGKRKIHTENGKAIDDDSSAVRFWFSDETARGYLVAIFEAALEELRKPEAVKPQ